MQLHSPCKTLSTSKGLVKWSLPSPSSNPTKMIVVIVQTGPEPGVRDGAALQAAEQSRRPQHQSPCTYIT